MDTERDAIEELRRQGYAHDFFIVDEGVRCLACESDVVAPEDLRIEATYRFEGASDPDDMSVVFAVSEGPCGLQGVLVAPFGPDATGPRADVLRRLGVSRPGPG